uniref:Serine-threonine/tyrosine-protein kinase catalytic domain-containing protein n=1 Tax=Salix viminalis TaxID=40686 RepID=A0A6N2MKD9_SALVM
MVETRRKEAVSWRTGSSVRLGNNSFSGEIPANISSCANLIALRLEGNNLTGKLPEQLESLSKLKVLNFKRNNLVGEIPPSFGNLSSIVEIRGMGNGLKGVIPHSIGRLKRLEIFSFGVNNLSGTIPPSIFNLSTNFAVPVNQLHGTLPPDLGHTLPNLEIFLVHTNHFSGLIPMTISNASNLSDVQLSVNFFTGKIPSLGSLPNLRQLSIGYNDLGSGQDDDLSFLYPLENNTVLEIFEVAGNHLGGVLPEILGNFSKHLWVMEFGRNQIRGTIPDGIGNLVSFAFLSLESNQLGGMIPSSIGSLPLEVGNLVHLVELDVSKNRLSGEIPHSLGSCASLELLSLKGNFFKGSIPESLSSSRALKVLDLSHNNLSGQIPKLLGDLKLLESLDLSFNDLEGQVPVQGAFGNASVISMAGNKKLCGGIPQLNLSRCTTNESAKLKSSTSSVGLKGTVGYAAPEYGVGSDVSTYGDVYSFGILLLEMFTGKRPTDDMFKDGLNLHNYAELALPGRVSEVVEPTLLQEDVESSIHSSHRMNHTETGKTLE